MGDAAETSTPHPAIRDVITELEAWAPPGSAQEYDNVGLQVGEAGRTVERGIVALDLTADVVEEAKERDASLIITHHPLLFHSIDSVTPDTRESGLALRLAEAGIALYCIHTNLDAARNGVSFALAERLGLQNVSFLDGYPDALCKLTTFVPTDHLETVHEALAEAGAGRIGEYEACAFTTEGTGYFQPTGTADPYVGSTDGELQSAHEQRLEMEVPRWKLGAALQALHQAHPYDEVAYDVYPVQQKYSQAGLGALGHLDEPTPLSDFLQRVAHRLEADSLRYAGNPNAILETVAVCGGAGSDFTGKALAADADAYVTADVTYHEFFDVLDGEGVPQMALIDPGHYETEALTERLLVNWLHEQFASVEWLRTETRTSPMRTFIPSSS